MPILKFRVYFEEDDSVYRDIVIRHNQYFIDLHLQILKSFEFDSKHEATFYRSNDYWQRGKEITLEKYDKEYKAEPLLMSETTIGSEIKMPNQKFVYMYDFNRYWPFLVELINVSKEENPKLSYPSVTRVEGIAPSQYGTKGLLGPKFADIEEKYDLTQVSDNIHQVFRYLELPLIIRYKVIDQKVGLNFSGGLSYGYLVDNFAYASDGANMIPVGHTDGVNIHSISSQLGLGMEYNISTNISFNLEPVFKYYVTPVSNLSGTLYKPYSVGFFSGVFFKF